MMLREMLCGLLFGWTLVLTAAAQNIRPVISITGERYVNRSTYLLTGTVMDDQPGTRVVYRIRKEEYEIPSGGGNWQIRLRLEDRPTRLVFFAVDSQNVRSDRQKRLIVLQPPAAPES